MFANCIPYNYLTQKSVIQTQFPLLLELKYKVVSQFKNISSGTGIFARLYFGQTRMSDLPVNAKVRHYQTQFSLTELLTTMEELCIS